MLEIINGRIFVEGIETIDAELIGYAVLDFAESTQGDFMSVEMKDGDVFVKKAVSA